MDMDMQRIESTWHLEDDTDDVEDDDGFEDEPMEDDSIDSMYDNVPIILPRRRFSGACNVETVKDGAFTSLVMREGIYFVTESELPWSHG